MTMKQMSFGFLIVLLYIKGCMKNLKHLIWKKFSKKKVGKIICLIMVWLKLSTEKWNLIILKRDIMSI
ncbi:MAG: hypothetical protein EGQ86_25135 [Alistipes sp.]|nr:hypothetical protein [Alistipes sp.]